MKASSGMGIAWVKRTPDFEFKFQWIFGTLSRIGWQGLKCFAARSHSLSEEAFF